MMNTKATIRRFVEENFMMGSRRSAFADNASFMEHHIIDSTGFLELITFIEEMFGITVEEDEMLPDNLDNLDAIHAYLTRKLSPVAVS
ncbi:MAG TPA: acyl carrier protein [Burkholderiaceae bacterium]|jgi:acyl carrier protein|nr:acyl carrier protein [Burkholderiaceae bacterium]